MADVIDFNQMLYREILNGREYENLIPQTNCKSKYLGTGNTDLSIVEMKKVVEAYSWQMQEVAQKLQSRSLQETTNRIFDFCFNHFQYFADEEDQMLRSPSCSWAQRESGIDCKSYSIVASSILRELGINHYIRKIKQPGFAPTEYTHVYVIVPIEQQTDDLNSGYHVIDATVRSNQEPLFIEHKDEYMSGLKHYALNAPQGMGVSLNLNTIAGSIIGCDSALNNSSYTPKKIKQLFPNGVKEQLTASGISINVNSASLTKFVALMNRVAASGNILATGGYDKCTTAAGKLLRDASTDAINKVLEAIQMQGITVVKGAKAPTNFDVKFGTYNNSKSFSTSGYPSDTFTVVGSGTLVFDVNSLQLVATNPTSPTLPDVTVSWPPAGGNNNGGVVFDPNTGTYEQYENLPQNQTTSKMGMSSIAGIGILAAAAYYAFSGSKSTSKAKS